MAEEADFQQQTHFVFRREQILADDVREFLRRYSPSGLTPLQMRMLFGRVSIELDGAVQIGDLATIPETRTLIRTLHRAWPWAGFFLHLTRPLGSPKTIGSLPILAYALCLIDLDLIAWDRTGECEIRIRREQFAKFRDECFYSIDHLGKRAGIPPEVIAGRQVAVDKQLERILQRS